MKLLKMFFDSPLGYDDASDVAATYLEAFESELLVDPSGKEAVGLMGGDMEMVMEWAEGELGVMFQYIRFLVVEV